MRSFHGAAHPLVEPHAQARASGFACLCLPQGRLFFVQFFLQLMSCAVFFVLPACSQDNGSEANQFHGRGAEITVTVHDGTGEPISTAAIVKLLRDGTILSRQGETSRGSALLVVNNLGDFTVIVEAPGYEDVQKEISIKAAGRMQVDIYLRRIANGVARSPGRPLLAPKAKEALEKGLQALGADRMKEAEKYVGEAVRLAPAHPDVLYVQGVLYLKERNWSQAQTALEKAIQIDPAYARAFAALGMALCDQAKYDAAINPLEKSLQLDSAGSWETRWSLAKAYYQHQQYSEALKVSQEALSASDGKAPEITLLVAQSLTAVGRYDDAAQALRNFLTDHGDHREAPTARKWLERLTASGKIRPN
jgi:Tfp pilus assembly protein PilF